jgi:hypothetical protein
VQIDLDLFSAWVQGLALLDCLSPHALFWVCSITN